MTCRSLRAAWLGASLCLLSAIASPGADLFVDAAAGSDTNDGLSWATARATVGSAIATAAGTIEADTISVAAGLYVEHISVPNDVTLLGGFPAAGGTRDPGAHPTILDGEGRPPSVVSFLAAGDRSTIDGFVIRGGGNDDRDGGGIYVVEAAPLIKGNIIEANRAMYGGGICLRYSTSRPVARIEGNIIRNNIANYPEPIFVGEGGGVYIGAGSLDLGLVLVGNRITGNVAEVGGGVRATGHGAMAHCIVDGNSSVDSRWGAHGITLGGNWTLFNVAATNNMGAGLCGRGAFSFRCDNVTLAGNQWGLFRGAFCSGNDLEMTDSIAWGNRDGAVSSDASCPPARITASIIQGGFSGGVGIIDADPLFVPGPLGDYYLSQATAGQPTTSPAIDSGDQDAVTRGLEGRTTATTSAPDAGILDLGFHYELVPSLTILRGTRPDALTPHAVVGSLPFIDTPGTLSDPTRLLLCYSVQETTNEVAIDKDLATDAVRLSFLIGP